VLNVVVIPGTKMSVSDQAQYLNIIVAPTNAVLPVWS